MSKKNKKKHKLQPNLAEVKRWQRLWTVTARMRKLKRRHCFSFDSFSAEWRRSAQTQSTKCASTWRLVRSAENLFGTSCLSRSASSLACFLAGILINLSCAPSMAFVRFMLAVKSFLWCAAKPSVVHHSKASNLMTLSTGTRRFTNVGSKSQVAGKSTLASPIAFPGFTLRCHWTQRLKGSPKRSTSSSSTMMST